MTNTQRFAKQELDILAATVPDAIITPFSKEILALCEAFGKSGQSGGSAPMTASAISQAVKKLMLQEPICPITGVDEEWISVRDVSEDDEMMYQNKRCSALFKSKGGKCWYIDAIVWKDEQGMGFTGSALSLCYDKLSSRQYIKAFPFTPKTFYVDVISKEIAPDDWESVVKDEKQLEKVFKYYSCE